MARPTKQGITYFPLDTDFDDKIEMFIIEKESVGLAFLITAWQLIYRNEGYYSKADNDFALLIKKRINADISEVNDCIMLATTRGIFNKNLFEKYGVLTSKAVQKRYFDAAKRKRWVEYIPEFILVDVNEYKNLKIVNNNPENVDNNTTNINVNVNTNVNTNVKEEVKETPEPTREEVREFFLQENSTKDEADLFFAHYAGKDWLVFVRDGPERSIKKTRKWKLKAEEWIKRNRIEKGNNNNGQKTSHTGKGQLDKDNFARILNTDMEA